MSLFLASSAVNSLDLQFFQRMSVSLLTDCAYRKRISRWSRVALFLKLTWRSWTNLFLQSKTVLFWSALCTFFHRTFSGRTVFMTFVFR